MRSQTLRSRVRPGSSAWPAQATWAELRKQVGEALIAVRSPLAECAASNSRSCTDLFRNLKNPYFISDEAGLTQTLGWVDGWTSMPSVYAVAARQTADVVAAVDFARENKLRLVIKGGGHSYQGTSNAPDSLLVWTRQLRDIRLHETFVPQGCEGHATPVRAVTVGSGALWGEVYDAVTTNGGGYVQGGGCLSVGVGGLIQSGGFGSFSKAFGLAAASLLEAQVVTADGLVRTANARINSDLFWALKRGGGGTFGVVTSLTLKVHPLPETFGAVNFTVRATSKEAYRSLVALMVDFLAKKLVSPHWGEQIRFRGLTIKVSMVFQGLTRQEAKEVWQELFDALDRAPELYQLDFAPLKILSTSARTFFSPTLAKRLLGLIRRDDRPGAPATNVFWPGDQGQAGQILHGFDSVWLPESLLQPSRQIELVDALMKAASHWGLSLHLNKGLAGAPSDVMDAARNTAMNPAVLSAFALAISSAEEQGAYPGIAGHEPDQASARKRRAAVTACITELRNLVGFDAAYLAESNFFDPAWADAFWGKHHKRLQQIKVRYDPDDLFIVHHGIGSERWSADGFQMTQ